IVSARWIINAGPHAALISRAAGFRGYFVLTKASLSGGVDSFVFGTYRDGIGFFTLFRALKGICRSSLRDGCCWEMSTVLRGPADQDEDLKLVHQELRGHVEAVLNSLAPNLSKAVVLCQVERAEDALLNQLYSSIRENPRSIAGRRRSKASS
ncbi:hypothetical protein KC19_11G041000, partial [Ceratodon purpureus]